jgi:hypothetical protein
MNVPVIVSTCDKYLWALRPFSYLFNTYWSAGQRVIVVGYARPPFDLPPNFDFYSIAPQEYAAQDWSTGMLEFFKTDLAPELFVWLLEDYWLCRQVDNTGVNTLTDYAAQHPGILRVDLTTDRLYNGQMFDVESFGHYDIVETPYKSPYQMSLQAGIWRKSHLLRILRPNLTPWQVEIDTRPPKNLRVIGTRQYPVRYLNAFKGNDPTKTLNLDQLTDAHRTNVFTMIPDKFRNNV